MRSVGEFKISRHIRFRQHQTMTACWVWTGPININTGQCVSKGTTARRAVWVKLRGALRDDEQLRPLCKKRDCVNPNHMRRLAVRGCRIA